MEAFAGSTIRTGIGAVFMGPYFCDSAAYDRTTANADAHSVCGS